MKFTVGLSNSDDIIFCYDDDDGIFCSEAW